MSITIITTSQKATESPADGFLPCCGLTPLVLRWNGKREVCVCCRNPECENAEKPAEACGVFAMDVDIQAKWERYRKR